VHEDEIWREKMPAAEAKKAGIASEVTLLAPSPFCLIGIKVCSH